MGELKKEILGNKNQTILQYKFWQIIFMFAWSAVWLIYIVGLVFNIFEEEIYYRGFLMPKMRAVFGSKDWTKMIMMPRRITDSIFDEAVIAALESKGPMTPDKVSLEHA